MLLRVLDENKITRTQFDEAANAPMTRRMVPNCRECSLPGEMVRQEMVTVLVKEVILAVTTFTQR